MKSRLVKVICLLCLLTVPVFAQFSRNPIRNDAYGSAWNGDTRRAPSADAVYDMIIAMGGSPLDPNLVAIAGLNPTTDEIFYWTGAGTVAVTSLGSWFRGILDSNDPNEVRADLQLGVVDVRNYPYLAKGDNSNDDTAEIQAALDAVDTGGVVFLPAGVYKCSATLDVTASNVTVYGAGSDTIIKSNADPAIRVLGSYNRFESFKIDDDGSLAADANAINCSAAGTTGCYHNHFNKLHIEGYDSGIVFSAVSGTYGCWWNKVTDCYFNLDSRTDAGNSGVLMDDSAGSQPTTTIIDNCVFRHVYYPINISDATPGTSTCHWVTNCEMTEVNSGIRIKNCTDNVFSWIRVETIDANYWQEENSCGYNQGIIFGDSGELNDANNRSLHTNSRLIQPYVTSTIGHWAVLADHEEYAVDQFSIRDVAQSSAVWWLDTSTPKIYNRAPTDFGQDGVTQGIITTWDGAGGNTPGYWKVCSPNGTAWYIFVEDDGTVKVHNAAPTQNSDGSEIGGQS